MALHIRDVRQSDAAGLSRLKQSARLLGALPGPDTATRILAGLRGDRIACAIWLRLDGETGILPALLVTGAPGWRSDILELISEASLWLTSRGAARIELHAVAPDTELLAGLLEMHFKADTCAGVLLRLPEARSAA